MTDMPSSGTRRDGDSFVIGDVVEWTEWLETMKTRRLRGAVVKVTASTVTARPYEQGLADKAFRRRKYSPVFECRKVDVAREKWFTDLVAWWEDRPRTKLLTLLPLLNFEGASLRMPDAGRATTDGLEELASEAYAIREWLRKRPAEPDAP